MILCDLCGLTQRIHIIYLSVHTKIGLRDSSTTGPSQISNSTLSDLFLDMILTFGYLNRKKTWALKQLGVMVIDLIPLSSSTDTMEHSWGSWFRRSCPKCPVRVTWFQFLTSVLFLIAHFTCRKNFGCLISMLPWVDILSVIFSFRNFTFLQSRNNRGNGFHGFM